MRSGIEQETYPSFEIFDGDNVPGVFGDDVDGQDVDFAGIVRDHAGGGAAPGVYVVEAVDQGAGGFDLHAQDVAVVDYDPVVAVVVSVGLGEMEAAPDRADQEFGFSQIADVLGVALGNGPRAPGNRASFRWHDGK